jgi:hypothetical protein
VIYKVRTELDSVNWYQEMQAYQARWRSLVCFNLYLRGIDTLLSSTEKLQLSWSYRRTLHN